MEVGMLLEITKIKVIRLIWWLITWGHFLLCASAGGLNDPMRYRGLVVLCAFLEKCKFVVGN